MVKYQFYAVYCWILWRICPMGINNININPAQMYGMYTYTFIYIHTHIHMHVWNGIRRVWAPKIIQVNHIFVIFHFPAFYCCLVHYCLHTFVRAHSEENCKFFASLRSRTMRSLSEYDFQRNKNNFRRFFVTILCTRISVEANSL